MIEVAIEELKMHQTQLDMDGVMVGVSRQALEELLAHVATPAPPAPISGLEPVAWGDVVGFEEQYEVSTSGDIRSKRTGEFLSKPLMGAGYQKADLYKNGERLQTSVHRIVAAAFLHRESHQTEVNHKDGDKTNNHVSNLEWVTKSENEVHSRYELGNLSKALKCVDVESGAVEFYRSINEADKAGYNRARISLCIAGRCRTHGGKTWHVIDRDALEFSAAQLEAHAAAEREVCLALALEHDDPVLIADAIRARRQK